MPRDSSTVQELDKLVKEKAGLLDQVKAKQDELDDLKKKMARMVDREKKRTDDGEKEKLRQELESLKQKEAARAHLEARIKGLEEQILQLSAQN
jgi:predicted  nucleic acid-binding Zn-ribbon protein